MSLNVIRFSAVSKLFSNGQVAALTDFSLELRLGEVFGLIGPNGAGKTTFLRLLMGLLKPTSGEISWPDEYQARQSFVACVLDAEGIYLDLSIEDNLQFFGALYGIDPIEVGQRAAECLEHFGLHKKLGVLSGTLSKGQRKIVSLCRALLVRPKVLIVDEITANLDPSVQYQLIDYLLRLNQTQGTTIIFSSHDLVHVTRMAKHIVLVAGGCKRLDMDNDAVSRYRSYRWQGDGAMGKLLMEGLARHKVRYFSFDNSAITAVAPDISQLESAFRAMDLPGITRPSEFEPATLEEVFLAYTR